MLKQLRQHYAWKGDKWVPKIAYTTEDKARQEGSGRAYRCTVCELYHTTKWK